MDKKTVLVFGVGELQKSIIGRAHLMGLCVVGIDPCADAACKNDCDAFEIVDGQDYEGTIEVCRRHHVDAIITAATDKPLVMMARVAATMGYRFYGVDTAIWSTDKFQMKQRFILGGVPYAQGRTIASVGEAEGLTYPIIVKPRDNSGSRGVKLCLDKDELQEAMTEASQHSRLDSVLVEEFIEGQEYSIEALHYNGHTEVIQFTEKRTTEFPYNVELGHKQPANLTETQQDSIAAIISKTASCMGFDNCPSHTELKINGRGIFVIETSPRLGGDYITSHLTPLSTGINLEDQLLNIALGRNVDTRSCRKHAASAVSFLSLRPGRCTSVSPRLHSLSDNPNIVSCEMKLKAGDQIPVITSSLDRYGHFIVSANSREELDAVVDECQRKATNLITVES